MISYEVDEKDIYFFADVEGQIVCEVYERGLKPNHIKGWKNVKITSDDIRKMLAEDRYAGEMGIGKIMDELDLLDAW